jgi:nucleoside-diphosphate-sugar epimerase
VTGATGFIGSHLVNALLEAGWSVRALVRQAAAADALSKRGVAVARGDLDDATSLSGVADGIDAVFHTAAKLNMNRPDAKADDFATNVQGTSNLIAATRGKKVRAFVHVSSIAAIGIRPVGMIDESFPCDPDLPYGKSKLATDAFLRERSRQDGLPLRIVRPPTVYGPGERYNFLSLCQAIRGGRFLLIGRGDNRMDFCAVENLVQAMIKAAERGTNGETYLIADDRPLPFRETVGVLWRRLRGKALPRVFLPVPLAYAAAYPLGALGRVLHRTVPLYPTRVRTMAGDMCFDLGKARRELGYQPKGPFEEVVAPTIDWYWREGLVARPS